MRELTMNEIAFVSGGGSDTGGCTPDSVNDLGGIKNSRDFGKDLINIYDGAVALVSHVIEEVATSF